MFSSKCARFAAIACVTVLVGTGLTACNSGGDDDTVETGNNDNHELTANQIYAPDGALSATIRTTTGGVPHITADNLESVAFGSGYVQARDNVCIIADSIIRARGERAKFYGPGDGNINLITDFSYKALGLVDEANEQFDDLSDASQAMLTGFVAGYNKYIDETDAADMPTKCAGMPWVRDITPQDLYAYYALIALYASGDQFTTGVTFQAVPPGASSTPVPAMVGDANPLRDADFSRVARTDFQFGANHGDAEPAMASNGWGIGGDMTENGKGALLANPHFPYTGNRRLYQMQLTVPGVYNVNGAGLIGVVVPLIGFNQHLAWTHTVSTAHHFTLYDLTLKSGDNLTYIKDGEEKPITSKTLSVEVNVGQGPQNTQTFQRDFYYSEYGPMIAANYINSALPQWGDDFVGRPTAFTYRDANADTARVVVDQWLNMGRARNLEEFKEPYEACGSVLWVNTMYADDTGKAFYIDGTSVPQLSAGALRAYASRLTANVVAARLADSGVTLLDGSRSLNDWVEGDCDGRVPYAGMPKLQRSDYVQNSNDSYWATNVDELMTGYSPLYGPTENTLSPRTRMGLRMLLNPTDPGLSNVAPAGDDGKFTGEDIIRALYSNRAYYAETLLDDLLDRCQAAGGTAINAANGSRSIAQGCTALVNWNGTYDVDSRGAHVFRVFMANYTPSFSVAFDPDQPATTPNTPMAANDGDLADDPMLVALANGLDKLDQVNIAYDARLGDVQQQQQSVGVPPTVTPIPAGSPIPWPGNQNLEGGFNIVSVDTGAVDDGTRYPRVAPAGTLANSGDLSSTPGEGWRIGYGTSWHFGLNFTSDGPKGYGLVSYSQSDDATSDHFSDQDLRFSNGDYRNLLYSQADIASDPNLTTETIEDTVTINN